MKTSFVGRALVSLLLAGMAAPVMILTQAGSAAALACTSADSVTDPATTVTVTPDKAVREVGDLHHVVVHAECNGVPAAGDPIKIAVDGPNSQNRKDVLDEDGNFRWTYESYGGPGVDTITACTDTYEPQACGIATATWQEEAATRPAGSGADDEGDVWQSDGWADAG